jgi:hypothetical protein
MKAARRFEPGLLMDNEMLARPSQQVADDPGYLGSLHSDTAIAKAGSWQEIQLTYTVGSVGWPKVEASESLSGLIQIGRIFRLGIRPEIIT